MGGYRSDSPPPPAYGPNQGHEEDSTPYPADSKQSNSYTNNAHSPPQTRSPGRSYVRALYDYNAQAEGDLTFAKDDLIEVIHTTADVNDWWTGSLNGATGVFPGILWHSYWGYILICLLNIALTGNYVTEA
jgi:amphiphysin